MRYLLISALFITGCAPFVPQRDMRAINNDEYYAAQDVVLYTSTHPPVAKEIQTVEAWSCALDINDPPASKADVERRLKIEAYTVGANAVINTAYTEGGFSLLKNCWSYMRGYGTAVRLSAASSS